MARSHADRLPYKPSEETATEMPWLAQPYLPHDRCATDGECRSAEAARSRRCFSDRDASSLAMRRKRLGAKVIVIQATGDGFWRMVLAQVVAGIILAALPAFWVV